MVKNGKKTVKNGKKMVKNLKNPKKHLKNSKKKRHSNTFGGAKSGKTVIRASTCVTK
jgi:hypothetical protein